MTVTKDNEDRLWIACNYEGIWIYDHGKLYPFEQNSLFNKQHFVTLFKDQQGQIWIDVNRVGLFCWNGQICENITRKFNLPLEDIFQIGQVDSQTYLLLFGISSLTEFRINKTEPLKSLLESSDKITAFFVSENSQLQMEGDDYGIRRLPSNQNILLLKDKKMSLGKSTFLVDELSGNIWFYIDSYIYCYQQPQLASYLIGRVTNFFPYQDRFHNIWFATEQGLYKHQPVLHHIWPLPKPSRLDSLKLGNNPSNKFMFQDRSGRLWFTGCDGHLLSFFDNQVTAVKFPDSLGSVNVTDIAQDNSGGLWFGTHKNGIIYWDGKDYKRLFTDKLPGDYISALFIDSKNRLWIGSISSLAQFNNPRIRDLICLPEEPRENFTNQLQVTSFTVDENETVWFGTDINTIFYSVNSAFRRINTPPPMNSNYYQIQNLFYHDNKLWGTAYRGIFCFNKENNFFQFFQPPTFTSAIDEPPLLDNFHWITGDFYQTNSIYRLKNCENFKKDPAIPIYNISATCKEPAGGIWVGSYSVGLFYIDPDTLIRFDSKHGLTSLRISAIYNDQQNRLWIGTLDHGIFRREGENFIQTNAMKAVGQSITAFFEDRQHRLWIGTLDNGLVHLQNNAAICYQQNLPHPSVWGIGESPQGDLYVVLNNAKFARFDGNRFKILDRESILYNHDLQKAFKNRTINLRNYFLNPNQYISSGLVCWENGQIKQYTVSEGLPGHEISDIAETSDGKLWVATLNTGLAVLNGDHFQPVIQPDINHLSRFLTLKANPDSSLWVLSEEGLAYWKQNSFKIWGSNSKIVGYHAFDIQTNTHQQLLFSDESNFYYFNQGDIQKLPITFQNESSLQGIMPFFHIDNNDQIWFITTRRQLVSVPVKDSPPIIKIKNLQIGNDLYDESHLHKPIRIGYEERACAIEFFGYHSSFATSQLKNSIRISKNGESGSWSSFNAQNQILYSDLEPGKSYVFEIRAQTPNGLVSLQPAQLEILLDPKPFYLQSWFYWLLFTFGLIGIAFLFSNRYYQIKRIINQRRFNPYIAGEPILKSELFFGRDEIVKKILSILHNNSVMITGERRIGKTSLLLQLKKQLQTTSDPDYFFIPIFIDLQGVEQWEFFRALTHDILDQAGDSISTLPLKIQGQNVDYGYREFNADFRLMLRQLSAQHPQIVKLVLLIDEADAMNQYDQITHAQLRRIFMQDFSLNFGAIIAGTNYIQNWNRPESPWWNLFTMIELTAFNQKSAEKLIQAPVKGIFKFTPDALSTIIEKTQCKPYAIQTLCMHLVNRAFDRHRRTIRKEDVVLVFNNLNLIKLENKITDKK